MTIFPFRVSFRTFSPFHRRRRRRRRHGSWWRKNEENISPTVTLHLSPTTTLYVFPFHTFSTFFHVERRKKSRMIPRRRRKRNGKLCYWFSQRDFLPSHTTFQGLSPTHSLTHTRKRSTDGSMGKLFFFSRDDFSICCSAKTKQSLKKSHTDCKPIWRQNKTISNHLISVGVRVRKTFSVRFSVLIKSDKTKSLYLPSRARLVPTAVVVSKPCNVDVQCPNESN